jgi:hypothetical protein
MKWVIKKEKMGGRFYWMIYRRSFFFFHQFYERWNTKESANVRLKELLNGDAV